MGSLRHILMLLLLLLYTQEIGSGSECGSQCDCNIRLMTNGTLSWTFSTPMCSTANQGYIITKTQGASENILSCTCSSGQPDCRDIKPGYNYSIEKNRIVLTRNTSNEGTFQFETLPLNEKCHCEIFAQVPYVPEEDATTSTTRNPHPATTLTTSSITPTQDASSETNMWAVIVALAGLVVLLAVAITMHLRKQLKDKDEEISYLKAECNKNEKDGSSNTQDHVSVTIPDEVPTGVPVSESTQEEDTEETVAETAARDSSSNLRNVVGQDLHVPLYGAVVKPYDGHCVASSSAMPEPQDEDDDRSDDDEQEENDLLRNVVKPRDDQQVDAQHSQETQA